MKKWSMWSLGFAGVGVLFVLLTNVLPMYHDPLAFIGAVGLLFGVIVGFVAAGKGEKGSLKYIAIGLFFAVLLVVCVVNPLSLLRLVMWMKH